MIISDIHQEKPCRFAGLFNFKCENHYPKFGKHLPKDAYNSKCVKNKAATAGLFSIYHKNGSERDLRATLTAILDDLESRLNKA